MTFHAFENSSKNFLEVVIEDSSSLKDLENDLQENCSFGIIDCDIWLNTKHCLISNFDEHLKTRFLLHESISAINHVVVESIHKSIAESVLVFGENFLHARETL